MVYIIQYIFIYPKYISCFYIKKGLKFALTPKKKTDNRGKVSMCVTNELVDIKLDIKLNIKLLMQDDDDDDDDDEDVGDIFPGSLLM